MFLLNYLQTTQHLSRRKIVDLIKQWKISLNGQRVESFKQALNEGDQLEITGIASLRITSSNPCAENILLFNKPKGYVVSKSDVHNATIYELLPSEFQHYYYIGRLDKESRGLLVLTDSPRLVHQHEHPRFNITKEYLIQLSCDLDPMDIKKMKNGIFDEGECLKFQDIAPTSLAHQYKVLLNEGKKRHIRRVIKSLWYMLLDLQRIKEGERELWNLEEGSWRHIF